MTSSARCGGDCGIVSKSTFCTSRLLATASTAFRSPLVSRTSRTKLLPLLESQLPETVPQPVDSCGVGASLEDDSYAIDAGLLRLDGERHGEEAASQRVDEHSPGDHWMIWSARCSSDGGIVSPSAVAVLRLMISSNFLGCSIGKSPGGAPRRILAT